MKKAVPVRRRQDLKQRHHIPRQEDTMTNIWHLLTAHLHGITRSFNASKYLSSWEASYIVLTLGIQKVITSTSHWTRRKICQQLCIQVRVQVRVFEWYCSFLTVMYSPRTLVPGSHKVLVDGDTSWDTSEFKCQVVRRNSDEILVTSAGLGISFFFQSRPVERNSFHGPFGTSGTFF